jgi:hypothetical protein
VQRIAAVDQLGVEQAGELLQDLGILVIDILDIMLGEITLFLHDNKIRQFDKRTIQRLSAVEL